MKQLLWIIALFIFVTTNAQEKIYRAEREKVNNLIHTKLKVDFNFENSTLNGEAWLTLSPHFYPTKTLTLDAKSFTIKEVKLNNKSVNFNYSNNKLNIDLDKTYKQNENYTVYINYIANPEDVVQEGSTSIKDAKGLYFIDPKGTDPDKPTQVWTQGETEASSCWFPTIDAPNQKTTQEIYITVPSNFVTLSNGTLVSKTNNSNNTRTDYWKLDQPHAPYLFFMGVGEFSIVEDQWNSIPVNYYVEPAFENVAKNIFGNTPEMLSFYSKITGIQYPWPKYSQMVVRDFVSGAMENTTAVSHAEDAQQPKGKLIDSNNWEGTIAHEVFHHWFGNLVTTESWANLAINESFATYSTYLWFEYKYGKDRADAHMFNDVETYKESKSDDKNLVRFYYENKEHMFDPVSYNKGSAILHMLRDYLGDDAFFAGINHFLTQYKYGTAEVQQLRLAFEKITGKDLNWFFNQWFYGNGHITMNVSYDYNTINKTVTVNINQTGKTFKFPLSIDVYEDSNKVTRHQVWVEKTQESFILPFNKTPKLVNVDAKRILLADVNDRKTIDNYAFQYNNAKHYLDRREAIVNLSKHQSTRKEAYNTLLKALNDPYFELQILALQNIDLFQKHTKKDAIYAIEQLAKNHPKTLVKAEAIKVLGKLIEPAYENLFTQNLESESFAVLGNSIVALYQLNKSKALNKVDELDEITKKYLANTLTYIFIAEKDKTQLPYIAENVLNGMFLEQDEKTQQVYTEAFRWIAESNDLKAIEILANQFVDLGTRYKQYEFDKVAINLLNQILYQQQQQLNHTNKEEIILILKKALAKLIN